MRLSLYVAVLCWIVALPGCDDDRFLSGKWFTTELGVEDQATAQELAKTLGCPDAECEVYVELSMGHFGADVVGVVRFYRDERREELPCESCLAQRFSGLYAGGTLSFNFEACGFAPAPRARLELNGDSSPITGTLKVDDGDDTKVLELTFHKIEDEDQITAQDWCPETCSERGEEGLSPCATSP